MLMRFSASFIISSNRNHCFVSDKMCLACDPRPGVVRFLWSNSKWLQRNLENVKQEEWSCTNPLPLIIGMHMSTHTSMLVLRNGFYLDYIISHHLQPFISSIHPNLPMFLPQACVTKLFESDVTLSKSKLAGGSHRNEENNAYLWGTKKAYLWKRKNHVQGCLFRGYVGSEGKTLKTDWNTCNPETFPFFSGLWEFFSGCNGINLTMTIRIKWICMYMITWYYMEKLYIYIMGSKYVLLLLRRLLKTGPCCCDLDFLEQRLSSFSQRDSTLSSKVRSGCPAGSYAPRSTLNLSIPLECVLCQDLETRYYW